MGWNLARHGAQVIFIDAGQPGEGVTNWSFSWADASNKTARKSYFDLNVAGMAAHRELARIIGPGSWWHPSGHLRWADDPTAEAKLLKTVDLLASWGYRAEVYTGAEVRRRLEPALTVPGEVPVVFYRVRFFFVRTASSTTIRLMSTRRRSVTKLSRRSGDTLDRQCRTSVDDVTYDDDGSVAQMVRVLVNSRRPSTDSSRP